MQWFSLNLPLSLGRNLIDAEVAIGDHAGSRVMIPRITLYDSEDTRHPFRLSRRQFPLRPCFVMTINKAQGQTLKNICLYLPFPVFSHGQLYVALSRVPHPSGISIVLPPTDNPKPNSVVNVCYEEALQNHTTVPNCIA